MQIPALTVLSSLLMLGIAANFHSTSSQSAKLQFTETHHDLVAQTTERRDNSSIRGSGRRQFVL